MALVDDPAWAALVPGRPIEPRLLARAAGPGRVSAAAMGLLGAAFGDPKRAGPTISAGLRAARHLHSAERRLVADGIYDILRSRPWFLVNVPDTPASLWAAWLVRGGLDPAEVTLPGDFAAVARGDVARPDDPVAALARFGGFDPDVAGAFHRSWGDAAAALLAASRERAPFSVRANRGRGSRDALIVRLAAEGRQPRPSTIAADGVICAPFDVHTSAAWRDGAFEVQDEGSQLVAPVVAPQPGERIVDWCAGGGGKALHLAGLAACEVIARDEGRPYALAEVARRAGRARVNVRVDGGPVAPGSADAVLVDAPCSGTGTLRRRPELRLGLDAAEIARLVALQGRILDEAARAVRPGGRLVYATCSVLKEENDDVVAAFLARWPAFGLAEAHGANDGPVVRLAPHLHGTDGFFAAVLRRTA